MSNLYDMTGAIISPDWEFQRCKRCSYPQRLDYQIDDDLWEKVSGDEFKNRVLCLDCFLALADEKKIQMKKDDIKFICVISDTGWMWAY